METKDSYTEKLEKAKKRVDHIKAFYRHLKVYLLINILLLVVKFRLLDFLMEKGVQDQGFLDWFQWNFLSTPVIWGIALLVHALWVFKFGAKPLKEMKPKFLRKWEERQIKKYMEDEQENADKYR